MIPCKYGNGLENSISLRLLETPRGEGVQERLTGLGEAGKAYRIFFLRAGNDGEKESIVSNWFRQRSAGEINVAG